MNKIFKYVLKGKEIEMVEMPKGAVLLTAQAQGECPYEEPVIWASVDPDAPTIKRRFVIYITGERMNAGGDAQYIGTCQMRSGGGYVIHIFTDGIEYPQDA